MTDKDLIHKIQLLRDIQPDPEWVSFCRQTLLSKLAMKKEQPISRPSFWFGMEGAIDVFRRVPARVIVPLVLVLAVFFIGFAFNPGQINESEPADLVSSLPGNLDETGKIHEIDKSDIAANASKNDKKSSSLAGNISNGVKRIIDKVKTVTLGEDEALDLAQLKQEIQVKIDTAKNELEALFLEGVEDPALEQLVLILNEAQGLLNESNLTEAFDKVTAVERALETFEIQ